MPVTLSQTQINRFIADPVEAVFCLFGIELAVPQRVRLKLMWTVPRVYDFSGVATGKSEVAFFYMCLRAILLVQPRPLPPRIEATYYIDKSTAEKVFWAKFQKYIDADGAWLFRQQLKHVRMRQGLGDVSVDNCLIRVFKNGNQIWLPAAQFIKDAQNQASSRFNGMVIDEFAEIDLMSDGINKQLISRCNAPCYNSAHPVWANHIVYMGHAEDPLTHPAYERIRAAKKLIHDGSSRHALFTCCFRDFEDKFRWIIEEVKETAREEKLLLTPAEFDQKWHGVWRFGGANWYGADALGRCLRDQVRPELERAPGDDMYILGWDTAPGVTIKADWSAGVIIRARRVGEGREVKPGFLLAGGKYWELSVVHAVLLHGRTAEQCSGVIHDLVARFGCELVVMDPGGGGIFVYQRLRLNAQLIRNEQRQRVGLCTAEDAGTFAEARPIVTFFKRSSVQLTPVWGREYQSSDGGPVEAMHRLLRRAVTGRFLLWPSLLENMIDIAGVDAETKAVWTAINETYQQLGNITVTTDKNNIPLRMRGGFLKFEARGKKDAAMALLYAYCGVLSLLQGAQFQEEDTGEEIFGCDGENDSLAA